MRWTCLRFVTFFRVVVAALPVCKVTVAVPTCAVGIVVPNASPLVVSDAMPIVVAAAPVRATMIIALVDGVALLSLVI